jgi:hypothetical protein
MNKFLLLLFLILFLLLFSSLNAYAVLKFSGVEIDGIPSRMERYRSGNWWRVHNLITAEDGLILLHGLF